MCKRLKATQTRYSAAFTTTRATPYWRGAKTTRAVFGGEPLPLGGQKSNRKFSYFLARHSRRLQARGSFFFDFNFIYICFFILFKLVLRKPSTFLYTRSYVEPHCRVFPHSSTLQTSHVVNPLHSFNLHHPTATPTSICAESITGKRQLLIIIISICIQDCIL